MKKKLLSLLMMTSALTFSGLSSASSSEMFFESYSNAHQDLGVERNAPVQSTSQKNMDLLLKSFIEFGQTALQEANDAAIARAIYELDLREQLQIANDAAIARALYEFELQEKTQIANDAAIARAIYELDLREQLQIANDAAIARAMANGFDDLIPSHDGENEEEKEENKGQSLLNAIKAGIDLKHVDAHEKQYDYKADYLAEQVAKKVAAEEALKAAHLSAIRSGVSLNKVDVHEKQYDYKADYLSEQVAKKVAAEEAETAKSDNITLAPSVKHAPSIPVLTLDSDNIPPAPSFAKVFKLDAGSRVDQAHAKHQQNRGGLLGQIAGGLKLKSVKGKVADERSVAQKRDQEQADRNDSHLQAKIAKIKEEKRLEEDAQAERARQASLNARNALQEEKPERGGLFAQIRGFKPSVLKDAKNRILNEIEPEHIDPRDNLQNHLRAGLQNRRGVLSDDEDGFWD